MKKFLKICGAMLGILILFFALFLGAMTLDDFRPLPVQDSALEGPGVSFPDSAGKFSFVIWNIGYSGLGAKSDFFFDGGSGVRQSKATTEEYLNGITGFLKEQSGTDFLLLQEVDRDSRRSWHINQEQAIRENLKNHVSSFAVNYDCRFVPQPVSNPYGKCLGGLMSLSRFRPEFSRRLALEPDAKWPVGLFMLDRCLLEWRYPLSSGKDLVVYNLHLSAYDDGSVKQTQMDSLKAIFLREFDKGNYVVAGGDWNQAPPGYTSPLPGLAATVQMNVPADFPSAVWQWAFDTSYPTNRKLNEPYKAGKTGTDVIDFYLASPNVDVLSVGVMNLDFAFSDHQPVKMEIRLRP
jgi:endonuclease/exonuclease/phosphatase family metal-dependent hydrolase